MFWRHRATSSAPSRKGRELRSYDLASGGDHLSCCSASVESEGQKQGAMATLYVRLPDSEFIYFLDRYCRAPGKWSCPPIASPARWICYDPAKAWALHLCVPDLSSPVGLRAHICRRTRPADPRHGRWPKYQKFVGITRSLSQKGPFQRPKTTTQFYPSAGSQNRLSLILPAKEVCHHKAIHDWKREGVPQSRLRENLRDPPSEGRYRP